MKLNISFTTVLLIMALIMALIGSWILMLNEKTVVLSVPAGLIIFMALAWFFLWMTRPRSQRK